MKTAFVAGLWHLEGHPNPTKPYRDLQNAVRQQDVKDQTVAYAFGQERYKLLSERGYRTVLLDERTSIYPPHKHWAHKFSIWRQALKEYDQIVWLDWDIAQVKPLPLGFWETRMKGQSYQAILLQYRKQKTKWRRMRSSRVIPSGSMIYLRDPSLVDTIETIFNEKEFPTDEEAFAFWTDSQMGRWKGADVWNARYALDCCKAMRRHVVCSNPPKPENVVFQNWN